MDTEEKETPEVLVGDERLNEDAESYIYRALGDDETRIAVAGFDFETKVLVITDQRILIAGEEDGVGTLILSVDHDDISMVTRDGRTLIIETRMGGEHRFRFGEDEAVEELVGIADECQTYQTGLEIGSNDSIAKRVRFWEEQDKINQELIPRVIRQNELLTAHIAEHENLPEVAGRAISETLVAAREEQWKEHKAALDAAERTIAEATRATTQALADAREEQRGQYEAALDAAEGTIAEITRATTQALADERQEQRRQYEAALEAARRDLAQNVQTSLNQALGVMNRESRRTRNVLVVIAAGAAIISVAALVVSLFA